MNDPTFDNEKLKLQEHIRFLIANPIRDFQERTNVNIEKVDVVIVEGSVEKVKIKIKS